MTPVATQHLIRFVICCVDGHEWILIAGNNTYHQKCCICTVFCNLIVHTTIPCFVSKWSKCRFYSNHNASSCLILQCFIMKCISLMYGSQYKFQCVVPQHLISIQFPHTINVPILHPLSSCIHLPSNPYFTYSDS